MPQPDQEAGDAPVEADSTDVCLLSLLRIRTWIHTRGSAGLNNVGYAFASTVLTLTQKERGREKQVSISKFSMTELGKTLLAGSRVGLCVR